MLPKFEYIVGMDCVCRKGEHVCWKKCIWWTVLEQLLLKIVVATPVGSCGQTAMLWVDWWEPQGLLEMPNRISRTSSRVCWKMPFLKLFWNSAPGLTSKNVIRFSRSLNNTLDTQGYVYRIMLSQSVANYLVFPICKQFSWGRQQVDRSQVICFSFGTAACIPCKQSG